jgi:exonuclease SbcD
MRVAIISDSHFSERSRFDECVRIHDWIFGECEERGVVLTLHAGDVFDSKSTPKERAAVARWLSIQARLGPVVVVRGNHDALGDLKLFERLGTTYPIFVQEEAGTKSIVLSNGIINVTTVAWPRKAALLESGLTDVNQVVRDMINGLAMDCSNGATEILLMHATMQGSVTSSGQPLVGCDMELSINDLCASKFDLVALGHIHKKQQWAVRYGKKFTQIIYPGSPRRTNFGEVEDKGFLIYNTDTNDVEFVKTPATPMVHIDIDWREGGWDHVSHEPVVGAEVRLRFTTYSEERDAAKAAVKDIVGSLERQGAVSVKVEEVVLAKTRTRMPEVAEAGTITEKLQVYWHGESLSEKRKQRLTELVAKLEEEVE